MLGKSNKDARTADDPFALRWWDYGVLILFSTSLLVFCALVTIQTYVR
jgi:hypothetical protein